MSLLAATCLVNTAYSQNNNQRKNRQDEKRENERVAKMQDAVRSEQQQLQDVSKSLRTALIEAQRAESSLRLALADFRHAREAAEDRWEEKYGLPDQIRSLREWRAKYDSITRPIIEKVQAGDVWIVANKNAASAIAASKDLLDDDSISADQLDERLAKRDAMINAPRALETKAIDAAPEAKALKIKIDAELESLKTKRSKLDDEKIENDPQVKQAEAASQKAQKVADSAKKELTSLRSELLKKQSNLARATKDLVAAKQADEKDRNQPSGSKKKK